MFFFLSVIFSNEYYAKTKNNLYLTKEGCLKNEPHAIKLNFKNKKIGMFKFERRDDKIYLQKDGKYCHYKHKIPGCLLHCTDKCKEPFFISKLITFCDKPIYAYKNSYTKTINKIHNILYKNCNKYDRLVGFFLRSRFCK